MNTNLRESVWNGCFPYHVGLSRVEEGAGRVEPGPSVGQNAGQPLQRLQATGASAGR